MKTHRSERLLLGILLLMQLFISPAGGRDFRYVIISLPSDGFRPMQAVPVPGGLRQGFNETDLANAFDLTAYALQDTTNYGQYFPGAKPWKGLVFDVVEHWTADSLARLCHLQGRDWEKARLPEVMSRALGADFCAAQPNEANSAGPYNNYLPLTFRGRNCQVIWDKMDKLTAYLQEPGTVGYVGTSSVYVMDYAMGNVRHVVLVRTGRGNYVLFLLTRDLVCLQAPQVLPPYFESPEAKAALAAEASRQPVRMDTVASLHGCEGVYPWVAMHAGLGSVAEDSVPQSMLFRMGYSEYDLANAFSYRTVLVRDSAEYCARMGIDEQTDTVLILRTVKAWDADSVAQSLGIKAKRWKRQRMNKVLPKLLGKDFDISMAWRLGRVPDYVDHNLRHYTYQGRNLQPIWDNWSHLDTDKRDQYPVTGGGVTSYYYTFDYLMHDARHMVLCRTPRGNYLLLLLTRPVWSVAKDSPSVPSVPQSKRSKEATNLLNYLERISGKQMLSGTMANVAWNDNEALWVYSHTRKYPAINCVDYLHLYASRPGSWIDYGQTQGLEDWWAQNGIVAAMWHWSVPANNGKDYTFTPGEGPEQTSFDVTKINDPASPEYAQMMADIDKVADYLLLLKRKNIPVIWRPLHEAGGQWFWWGRDREAFKKLWRTMYERFEQKGLDNLIWVWTLAVPWNRELADGADWYPGDAYVDVVGYDMYGVKDGARCAAAYSFLKQTWPDKLVALSECGAVAPMSEQWDAGARWVWFMPWYEYERTNDVHAPAFKEEAHGHADADWWRAAVSDERVITRDEVPSLK